MQIRKAEAKDIPQILNLLSQVLEIHAKIRPDIFIAGRTKYTNDELLEMINNNDNLIYVAVEESYVLGYAMCEILKPKFTNTMHPHSIFYIDDFCVDEKYRQQKIGQTLFEYVKNEAKKYGCYAITLSSWEGNIGAKSFYEKMGFKTRYTMLEYIIEK